MLANGKEKSIYRYNDSKDESEFVYKCDIEIDDESVIHYIVRDYTCDKSGFYIINSRPYDEAIKLYRTMN